MKPSCRPPLELSMDVACKNFGLTESKLSGWRAPLSGSCVGYCGAIADSPQAGMPRHGKRPINEQRATFIFFQRKRLQEGARGGARGPNKRLRVNLPVAEEDQTRMRGHDGCVQTKAHPSQLPLLL